MLAARQKERTVSWLPFKLKTGYSHEIVCERDQLVLKILREIDPIEFSLLDM